MNKQLLVWILTVLQSKSTGWIAAAAAVILLFLGEVTIANDVPMFRPIA